MTDQSKRSSAGVWIAVTLLALLVAYPLSYGPVTRLYWQGRMPGAAMRVYEPLSFALQNSPEAVRQAYTAYWWWWVDDVMRTPMPSAVAP